MIDVLEEGSLGKRLPLPRGLQAQDRTFRPVSDKADAAGIDEVKALDRIPGSEEMLPDLKVAMAHRPLKKRLQKITELRRLAHMIAIIHASFHLCHLRRVKTNCFFESERPDFSAYVFAEIG
nr:hypothetical protein [Pelagibius sp.]